MPKNKEEKEVTVSFKLSVGRSTKKGFAFEKDKPEFDTVDAALKAASQALRTPGVREVIIGVK